MFRPLGDQILVRRAEPKEVSVGGIIIPEQAKKKCTEGTVVAVGVGKLLPDGTRACMEVTVGEIVVFDKYADDEVLIDDQRYLVVKEEDVLCVKETE